MRIIFFNTSTTFWIPREKINFLTNLPKAAWKTRKFGILGPTMKNKVDEKYNEGTKKNQTPFLNYIYK
jgi:hypothetical protein